MADAPYRWVVVAAGGLMGCVAMGSLFALPVLLTPMVEASGWSKTGISAAMTVAFLAMSVTSMIWGALSDRYGARPVVMAGGGAVCGQPVAGGACDDAVAVSTGVRAAGRRLGRGVFAPMMATVMGWFTTGRGLAVSLVSAGMGMAPVTMSPLAARLAEAYDWRTVLTVLSALMAVVSLGMATGPLMGGWIFDTTGGYGAMYITCFVLGLCAFLVGMTFRPFPR